MQKYHDEPRQYKGYLKSALINPTHSIFRAQPQVSDIQQRMRVAAGLLQKDLVMAGAGLHAGSASGGLISFFPPVLPYRVGRLRVDPSRGLYFRRDAVSLLYVPPAAAQAALRSQPAAQRWWSSIEGARVAVLSVDLG